MWPIFRLSSKRPSPNHQITKSPARQRVWAKNLRLMGLKFKSYLIKGLRDKGDDDDEEEEGDDDEACDSSCRCHEAPEHHYHIRHHHHHHHLQYDHHQHLWKHELITTSVVWWKSRHFLTRCPTLHSLLIQAKDLKITWWVGFYQLSQMVEDECPEGDTDFVTSSL